MSRPEIAIKDLLIWQKKTLAVAESCTGGLLSNLLTNIPGSSHYFSLGVVAYSDNTKISLLRISPYLITKFGTVSEQIARLMAGNVRRIASSDFGIGITGIAGPTGGTLRKPVGTVCIAVASKDRVVSQKFLFSGSRLVVKRKAVLKALLILRKFILEE